MIFLSLLSLLVIQSKAQQIPVFKAGTKIEERFLLYGQTVPMTLTIYTITDSVQLDWTIRGLASGSYLISAAGFENGTKINFVQPAALTVLRLAPDETFGLISKSAFKTLKENKRLVYNNTTYLLQENSKEKPFKAGDLELDVLHVVGVEEAGELWILNDPEFPLICQFRNNPVGIDFMVTGIK